MAKRLSWAFFGSSLVSAYWNSSAIYFRGLIRALAQRGHRITFHEPDAFARQTNRDLPDPPWAKVRVYEATPEGREEALSSALDADIIVKASGVGIFDSELESEVLQLKHPDNLVLFWDVSPPTTLDRIAEDPRDPFRALVPRFDLILTYGGGDPVISRYRSLGARECVPIYNALDRSTHFRVERDEKFSGALGFLGNRHPARETRVDGFFLHAASSLPKEVFVLGGTGWEGMTAPPNTRYLGQIRLEERNAFNSSVRAVLNLSRESVTSYSYPPTNRVFEAAGAGACIITNPWEGMEFFLEPGEEALVARDGSEVVEILQSLDDRRARRIGEAAHERIQAEHTYEHRAAQLERVLAETTGIRAA